MVDREEYMAGTEAATDPGISSRRSQEHDDEIVEIAIDVREIVQGKSEHGVDGLSSLVSPNGLKEADELEQDCEGTFGKENVEEIGLKPVAVVLKGMRLVSATVGHSDWAAVEQRFNQLQVDGMLPRPRFRECIGNFSGVL